jgi:hypothetical protein
LSVAFRNYDPVGDDIVDIISAHRAGVTEIADLNWCGSKSQNLRTAALGEALQIDSDIDLQVPQQLGYIVIALLPDIAEMIDGIPYPGAHAELLVRPKGDRDRLEAGAIMALEQSRRQERCRMIMKISRKVGNTNSFMTIELASRDRRCRRRTLLLCVKLRA